MYPLVSSYFAHYLFTKEKYDDAAEKYAYSNIEFEEVVLQYLNEKKYQSLSIYLTKLLSLTPKYSKYKGKRLLLCSFLLNELLAKIANLGYQEYQKLNFLEKSNFNLNSNMNNNININNNSNQINDRNPLIKFLTENIDDLDLESTTFHLQIQGKFNESYEFSKMKVL